MTPSIGRIVHYTLTADNAEHINKRRNDAILNMPQHASAADGVQLHTGNTVSEGMVFPMIITSCGGAVTADSHVNGQVFLDGNDLYWATSVKAGDGPGCFAWPNIAPKPVDMDAARAADKPSGTTPATATPPLSDTPVTAAPPVVTAPVENTTPVAPLASPATTSSAAADSQTPIAAPAAEPPAAA